MNAVEACALLANLRDVGLIPREEFSEKTIRPKSEKLAKDLVKAADKFEEALHGHD